MSTLRLFRETQSCRQCLYSWEGYAHGFARGHGVFGKDGRVVFAADDLGYLVPRGEPIEIEDQLAALGWHPLETCPRCGSRKLFPLACVAESSVDVPCLGVGRGDLAAHDGVWKLSAEALQRFA